MENKVLYINEYISNIRQISIVHHADKTKISQFHIITSYDNDKISRNDINSKAMMES